MSRLLLAVSASAAIFKACDLASKLTQEGHQVRALLTPNAARLISPQLFEALTAQPAATSEWSQERESAMDHIRLAHWAQLLVFAPATAASIARLAAGMADDLLGSVVLALPPEVPRLVCPAMNSVMYAHPAVQRNLARLGEDGWQLLEPQSGHLACRDEGQGRLSEPATILERVRELLP